MNCAKISASVAVNCDNPIQGGTKDVLYLFNFDDILDATLTRNGSNSQIIEDILLGSGITGYSFEGINSSTLPKNTFVKGRFLGAFDHEVNFKIWDLTPAIKEELEKMAKGRFVAIVENNYKGTAGNAAFEIYGLDSGLVLEAMERDPANADTQGAYDVTLKSSEQSREPHLPATFFNTSYANSKALVEALIG